MVAAALMTEAQAAWVREHAWTRTMRATYAQTPGFFTHCACQWGRCGSCERGQHRDCIHGPRGYQPFPSYEECITDGRQMVRGFSTPYVHPSRTATGWRRDYAAVVWLADRRCIWSCPCECRRQDGPRPQPVVLVAAGQQRRPEPVGQEALFGVMAP